MATLNLGNPATFASNLKAKGGLLVPQNKQTFSGGNVNTAPSVILLGNPQDSASGLKNLSASSFFASQVGLPLNAKFGTAAKAPEQNITAPANTISPAQAKVPSAPATQKTFTAEQNTGLMAALDRQKNGIVDPTGADKRNLDYAIANGWKAPTTNSGILQTTPPVVNQNSAPVIDTTSKGLLGSLANASLNPDNQNAAATAGLMNTAASNPATSAPGYEAYTKTQKDLADLDKQYAEQKALYSTAPMTLEVKQGAERALDLQYEAKRAALSGLMSNQQKSIDQYITGTGVQQTGYTGAGNLSNTGQSLEQSGLTSAAQLAQPTQLPYGTPLVNPQTGQQIGGGTASGVQPSDPFYQTMKTYAQLLASNQGSTIPTSITGNSVLNAQLINMAKQINPSFNANVASGVGSAQAATAGAQSAQVQQWTSALQQGKNLQAQLSDLLNTFGLNPSDLNKVNQGLQTIATNISDPKYAMLKNYVNDIANTYSQILTPAGGNATDTTRGIAASMLDSSMKGQGLQQVMASMDAAAQAKIAGVSTSGGMNSGVTQVNGQGLYNW